MTAADIEKHAVMQVAGFDEEPVRKFVLSRLAAADERHHQCRPVHIVFGRYFEG
jgi:hypothetical protein